MKKYKVEKEESSLNYSIKFKIDWWPFWKYLRKSDGSIFYYSTKRGAQGHVNLLNRRELKKN
jgi:hypothetical protein